MFGDFQQTIEMFEPYLVAIVSIFAATIAVQALMHFVVGRLVFFFAKRRYLPVHLQQMMDGWSDPLASGSLRAVATFASARLRSRVGGSYSLADDVRTVLAIVEENQRPQSRKGRTNYSFSLLKLVQCSLLALSDFEREVGQRRWFGIVKRLRADWLVRMTRMARSYDRLLHHRILIWLRQMRLIWRIPILFLVPLVGPPLLFLYVIRSLVITTLFEGPVRYFYGVFLLRLGYYALYLYNRKNKVINNRLAAMSTVELASEAAEFEERLNPKNWKHRSIRFTTAVTCYERMLREFQLPEDPISRTSGNHLLRRAWDVFGKVVANQGLREKPVNDSNQLVRLYREIGQVYYPGDPHPWLRLRLGELLDVGYMAAVLALHKASSVPGGKRLLDSVSLNIVLTVNRISDETKIGQVGVSLARIFTRAHSTARKANEVWSAVAKRTFPAALAVSLAGEVAWRQLADHYRGFVYHRAGRLILYACEQNALGHPTRATRPIF